MAEIVTTLGYSCPLCGKRVTVISSSARPPRDAHLFFSECECGYGRAVPRSEVQLLDVWWEEEQEKAA